MTEKSKKKKGGKKSPPKFLAIFCDEIDPVIYEKFENLAQDLVDAYEFDALENYTAIPVEMPGNGYGKCAVILQEVEKGLYKFVPIKMENKTVYEQK